MQHPLARVAITALERNPSPCPLFTVEKKGSYKKYDVRGKLIHNTNQCKIGVKLVRVVGSDVARNNYFHILKKYCRNTTYKYSLSRILLFLV